MTSAAAGLLAQTASEIEAACGPDPDWACEQVFRATGNDGLAGVVDLVFGAPLRILLVLAIAVVVSRFATRAVRRYTERLEQRAEAETEAERLRQATRGKTIAGVLRTIAVVVVWTVAALTVLGEVGISLGPLIAGAGVVGIALGFGAQSLVSDFLSGLFMLIEDQYGVGDVVDVGDATGVVEDVSLRTTKVRALDGTLWYVRNGEIARTGNMSQGWGRAVLDVGVGYDADLRQASEVIKRTADTFRADPEHADKVLEDPEIWGIQELGADAVAIRLVVKTKPGTQWGVGRELRLRIKEALDAEGIEIPFQQRTVWLRTEAQTGDAPLRISAEDGENTVSRSSS